MPSYGRLSGESKEGRRTVSKLLDLRKALNSIPARSQDQNLLLATWNIREFDSNKFGDRTDEAYYYIAEIVARFDLVAIQEVREDLYALKRLMELLGENWQVIFTDITSGVAGNGERMAFVFDTRKVRFAGLMGQVVLPPVITVSETGERQSKPANQLARTPLMCGFEAGWTDFILTTVHIIYGEDRPDDERRVEEIRQLASHLARRADAQEAWSHNWILLGDFNIYNPADVTMQALTAAGFEVPPELQHLPSNVAQNKFYDQIAFRTRKNKFGPCTKAGVFNFFDWVFRPDEEETYVEAMGKSYFFNTKGVERSVSQRRTYYNQWRTYQMSDHLPMWMELQIDYSDAFLEKKLKES